MPEQVQDKGLKKILSQKKYFLRFLKRYIHFYAAQNIAEDDLQLIDKSYIDPDFRKRESDIVYRVRNAQQDLIFYVILELQSKVDFTMPIRILFYITELLRRLFNDTDKTERERKDFRMPAVVPIILYTGDYQWTAECSYKAYTKSSELFGDNIIDFQYSILDLTAINSETLETGDSALDAIFLANKTGISKKVEGTFTRIAQMLPQIPKEQWPDLLDYILDVSVKILNNANHEVIQQLQEAFTKGDVKGMEVALDAYERALLEREDNNRRKIQEGIEVGKRACIEVGKREGQKETTKNLVKRMLHSNIQLETIIEVTGLSASEIEEIKNI